MRNFGFSSALLSCWEKPPIPLLHCISGTPTMPGLPLPELPALHPRRGTSPRSAYGQGSGDCWLLMKDPSPSPHLQETARVKKAPEVSWEEWTTSAQNTAIPAAHRASVGRGFTRGLMQNSPVSQISHEPGWINLSNVIHSNNISLDGTDQSKLTLFLFSSSFAIIPFFLCFCSCIFFPRVLSGSVLIPAWTRRGVVHISAMKWARVFLRCIFQLLALWLVIIAIFLKCIWTNVVNCWLRLNSKWLNEKSLENSFCMGWEGKEPWILCITAIIQTLFDIYSFLFRILQIVGDLLFSRVLSMHLPLQLHIGQTEKITW